MKTSDDINELAAALAKAQGQISPAPKDRENSFFHSHYTTLASCWEACREALAENGLAVVQPAHHCEGGVIVTTRLIHSSGQWIEDDLLMPVKKMDDAQAVGSAHTYGRRYGLCGMVGIVPELDDDGNAAAQAPLKPQGERVQKPPKAAEVAAQHGMTTGDKVKQPPPKKAASYADALFAASDLESMKKVAVRIDKSDKELPEKNAMYREFFKRLFDLNLGEEAFAWSQTKLAALRQTTVLDDATFAELNKLSEGVLSTV